MYTMAAKLIKGPSLPSLNGPQGIGVGCLVDRRRMKMKRMGMKYEMYPPSAGSETKALNAVVLPTLMMARRPRQTPSKINAFSGILSVGCTFANVLENGSPLSLENAQIRRETEANTLKKEMVIIMQIMMTKRLVAGFEPVAW